MSVVIKPIAREDRAAWENLIFSYAEFYKTIIPDGGLDRVWGWIHDENNDFWSDIARDSNGNVVGFVQYSLMHRSLSGEMICYMSDLYVEPKLRGLGTGQALIDHVLAFAKDSDISNVRWLTQENNYAGRQLYDSYTPKSDFVFYSKKV